MGAGGSKTKNTTEIVNETITNVIFDTLQSCRGPISQDQIISIKNAKNIIISNVSMQQFASIDMQCYQSSKKQTDIRNKLREVLGQVAVAKAPSFSFSTTKSENISKTINKLVTTVTDATTQNCIVNVIQKQGIFVDNSENVVINDIYFSQKANVILKCVQNSQSVAKNVNDLSIEIDQEAKAETKGILGELFSGLEGLWIVLLLIPLVIIIALIIYFLS